MINLNIIEPPEELHPFVRKFFLIQSRGKTKHLQKNVANPFTHLSFIPSKPPNPIIDDKILPIVDKLFLIGPITTEKVFIEYSGKIDQLALEFTSTGFYSLFHVSPASFTNNILPIKEVLSKNGYQNFVNDLNEKRNNSHYQKVIENFLIEKSKNSLPINDYVERALELIEYHHGYIPITSLAEELDISERQLRRKFKEVVGIPPKTYCKILNSHYIISCIKEKDYKSIQDLAHRSNFYDVAHFCNRFKKIMGFSPTEFINSDLVDISKKLYNLK